MLNTSNTLKMDFFPGEKGKKVTQPPLLNRSQSLTEFLEQNFLLNSKTDQSDVLKKSHDKPNYYHQELIGRCSLIESMLGSRDRECGFKSWSRRSGLLFVYFCSFCTTINIKQPAGFEHGSSEQQARALTTRPPPRPLVKAVMFYRKKGFMVLAPRSIQLFL